MIGRRFPLFRMFGFQVKADLGWVFIALLVAWSLAFGAFPAAQPGLEAWVYVLMGIVGAVGLFASILLHEASHAAVARRYGLETRAITLWIFGGVAETTEEPGSPKVELRVALAGPACSLVLGAVALALAVTADAIHAPVAIPAVLGWLGWMNLVLGIFNLLPGFPLDGGRVLRALLWRSRGDLVGATRTASRVGETLGLLLVGGGILLALGGNLFAGLWWVLLGSFLRRAAEASLLQVEVTRVLEGVAVHRIMDRTPTVVPPGTTLERFVEDYAYARGHLRLPVARPDALLGYVDLADVRRVPRGEWARTPVDQVTHPIDAAAMIDPDATGAEALRRMRESGASSLFVAAEGRLEGVVSTQDLARVVSVRGALEGGRRQAALRASELTP